MMENWSRLGMLECKDSENPYLPQKYQTNDGHQDTGHTLLLRHPRTTARVRIPKCVLAGMDIMCLVWKRPCLIVRVCKTAALERVLYRLDTLGILGAEHMSPRLIQATEEAVLWADMCAEQRDNHG